MCLSHVMHSKKTPGSNLTRKGSIWGQTPFRVNDDLEIRQLDAEYDLELGQSDPILCQIRRKLTDYRVIVGSEWSLTPMALFRVTLTRVFSEYGHGPLHLTTD